MTAVARPPQRPPKARRPRTRRRLLGITGGLALSPLVAGTAFADTCLNVSRAAPACHPTCTAPVVRGNWVWRPRTPANQARPRLGGAVSCSVGDGPGPEDAAQQVESSRGSAPPPAQLLLAQLAPNVPQDEHRHDHVVERPENGDELRDEVNRADEPEEQPGESEARPGWKRAIRKQIAHQPQKVRHDGEQVPQPGVSRAKQP